MENADVQIVGSNQYRCTLAGISALTEAGCVEGQCLTMHQVNVPFQYSDCESSETEECKAWKWLHCAFPDDMSSGSVMHGYFFVKGQFQGEGFAFSQKDVSGLLQSAGISSTVEDGCAVQHPDAANVVTATLATGEQKNLVLFGWDGCPCTGIAQARFSSATLCSQELTWSDPNSDVMKYLQCKVGDTSAHSFVYFRDGGGWRYHGTGFAFAIDTMTENDLSQMSTTANVQTNCANHFSVNLYGETLSECRAAATDASGSWMWDGKCTEQGGGVHQICMDQLPADFSVTTGQGPWSEGRANLRHCVCIGAWSLYMTREEDPAWTTSEAHPFCDAIPLSALTQQYLGKWKDWNGIPAQIVLGASKLYTKCLLQRAGPGSSKPSNTAACYLNKAFKDLQSHETALQSINADQHLTEAGFDCSDVTLPELGISTDTSSLSGGSGGGAMQNVANGNAADSGSNTGVPAASAARTQEAQWLLLPLLAVVSYFCRAA
jgi:hypothetical protein